MDDLRWTRRRLGVTCAALLSFTTVASSVQAQAVAPEPAVEAARRPAPARPLRPGVWRLQGSDPTLPTQDLGPLRRLIGNASVVGLGESFHTSGGFYRMKHRLFRFLVEEMGFRAFAMETSWAGADRAARYVETCAGSPEEALRGHLTVWQSTELSELVQWMCEWNSAHPDDPVTYFGFDVQQPEVDGRDLIAFLRRIGITESHAWVAGIRACDSVTVRHPYGGVPQETHDQCIQALDEIEAHFEQNAESIEERTSPQDFAVAELQVVGLRAWEDQVFLIAHDFPAGYSARDIGMAYAFLALREMRVPGARTAIWAANSHISRAVLPNGARPMGSHLAAALGNSYVSFAFTAYEAEIDFPGFGCGPVERLPGSVEERLHKLGEETLLVDLTVTRRAYLPRRVSNMGIEQLEPHKDFTGLIYMERSAKMNPLAWPSCQ